MNMIRAQGMFVQLKRALQQIRQVKKRAARRRRARENKEALHDVRGAARLAMGEVQLAARVSSVDWSRSNSVTPRMAVSGLFSS